MESHFSPYSVYIPLQDESHMRDEVINTFPYIAHLSDSGKPYEVDNYYKELEVYFKDGKIRGIDYVQAQWKKVKAKYICPIDSVKAISLFIEITRKNSKIIKEFEKLYIGNCKPEMFFFRISKTTLYIRKSVKLQTNLKISMELGDEIN